MSNLEYQNMFISFRLQVYLKKTESRNKLCQDHLHMYQSNTSIHITRTLNKKYFVVTFLDYYIHHITGIQVLILLYHESIKCHLTCSCP